MFLQRSVSFSWLTEYKILVYHYTSKTEDSKHVLHTELGIYKGKWSNFTIPIFYLLAFAITGSLRYFTEYESFNGYIFTEVSTWWNFFFRFTLYIVPLVHIPILSACCAIIKLNLFDLFKVILVKMKADNLHYGYDIMMSPHQNYFKKTLASVVNNCFSYRHISCIFSIMFIFFTFKR